LFCYWKDQELTICHNFCAAAEASREWPRIHHPLCAYDEGCGLTWLVTGWNLTLD